MGQNLANLINRQNSGQMALLVSKRKPQISKFNAKDLVVKIDKRVERNFLSVDSYMPVCCQPGQEFPNLFLTSV